MVSVGNAGRERLRLLHHRADGGAERGGRAVLDQAGAAHLRDGRDLRRLYDLLVVQPADVGVDAGRRMAVGGRELRPLRGALPDRRVARLCRRGGDGTLSAFVTFAAAAAACTPVLALVAIA